MGQDPHIHTERLILRRPVLEDFGGWAQLMGDEESAQFIGGRQPRAAAWRTFLTIAGAWDIQGFSMFSVIERASGAWIGRVGPWLPVGWPGPEVGWAILRSHWGQGYAGEAAAASIDWAFEDLAWHEVIHCIAPENAASQRLAARLGSTNRGPGRMPPPYEDSRVDIWGQTRQEWRSRHVTPSPTPPS